MSYYFLYITTMAHLNRMVTSYPSLMEAKLNKIWQEYKNIQRPTLLFHQFYIRRIMTDASFGIGEPGQARGMLVMHGLGSGKTAVAAACLLALIDLFPPVLIIKKALQDNFIKEIKFLTKFDRDLGEKAISKLSFITADAFNAGDQMKTRAGTLSGKLVIVDEAHNFFKSIINSKSETSNARIMFDMIMQANNCRLLFLTATPLDKDPFELAPCINMLTGTETLPSNYEVFTSAYVSPDGTINNKAKLQNRMFGLISYINYTEASRPDETKEESVKKMEMPEKLPIDIVKVPMSTQQYSRYMNVRDEEEAFKKARASKAKNKREKLIPNMAKPPSSLGSYYIKSRQISLFSLPLDLLTKPIKQIDDKYFTAEGSPKIKKLMENLEHSKKPVLVYSQFINYGLNVIERYLKLNGYTQWTPSYGESEIKKPGKRFAVISGEIKPEDRTKTQRAFNDPDNKYGDIISVLLISESGAEGLNLKNVREVHVLEPYWDWARVEQVQGRAIRRSSHIALPEEERDVKTFIYLSMPPSETGDKYSEKYTIDEKLLRKAIKGHKILQQFVIAMREVSIECALLNHPNCKICVPNDVPLYNKEDPVADVDNSPDPCLQIKERETKATSIDVEGERYFYKKDTESPYGYAIFIFNKDLDGYQELEYNSPVYQKVLKAMDVR